MRKTARYNNGDMKLTVPPKKPKVTPREGFTLWLDPVTEGPAFRKKVEDAGLKPAYVLKVFARGVISGDIVLDKGKIKKKE